MGLDYNEPFQLHVDNVIDKLKNATLEKPQKLTSDECIALAFVAKSIFEKESIILSLSAPIIICGDIHGQFKDLIRVFDMCGSLPKKQYLFLGDYVDRGSYGLECICLLFSLKIRYPSRLFLLRGNHESENLNRFYGFRDEIRSKYCSSRIWKAMLKAFNCLPICALIDKSIFCCHGGLSPLVLQSKSDSLLEIFSNIKRPCPITLTGLICDTVWSDPADMSDANNPPTGWSINDRGCSWTFGYDVVEQFLEKFDLDLIVRAHQVVEDGYEFFCNKKLITIFSAPNYCGTFDNAGAVLCLTKNFNTPPGMPPIVEGMFTIIQPNESFPEQWADLPKCIKSKKIVSK